MMNLQFLGELIHSHWWNQEKSEKNNLRIQLEGKQDNLLLFF